MLDFLADVAPPSSGIGFGGYLAVAALGLLIVIAAIVLVIVLVRRSRRPKPPPPSGTPLS